MIEVMMTIVKSYGSDVHTEENRDNTVHVCYLDPRNLFALIVYFAKHVKEKNLSLWTAIHSILFHVKSCLLCKERGLSVQNCAFVKV